MAEDGDKQDKTESATPKRRDDAREQGQVAMSQDAVAAAALVGAAIVLVSGGRVIIGDRHLAANEQPSANLLLALGHIAGVEVEHFGASTGRLDL